MQDNFSIHEWQLNRAINELNEIISQQVISQDKIVEVTRQLFRRALVYCYLKKEIPNLLTEYNTADNSGFMDQTITMVESGELQKQLLKLNTLADLQETDQEDLLIQTQKSIDDYDKFINTYNRYKNILEKYVDISKNAAKVSFESLRKIVTKTPAYKFANEWTWDISISSRIWAAFTSYSNDRNIFLYDLNLLPDNMKNDIVSNYKILYEKINDGGIQFTKIVNKNPTQMVGKDLSKFVAVMSAFCTEVFLNLTTADNKPVVESDIDNFITNTTLDEEFNTLSEKNIIEENNEIIQNDNTQNTKSITTIDEGDYTEPNITLHGGTIDSVYDDKIIPKLIIEQIGQQATHPLLTMLLLFSSPSSINPTQLGIIERVLDEPGLPPGYYLENENVSRAKLEQQQAGGSEPEDIFKTVLSIFHPLLPIYMIGNTFLNMGQNSDMDESLDYELYIKYSTYLNKLKTALINVYSGENNTTENKLKAYKIGFGLRELLFYSSDEEVYSIFCEILNMTPLEYFPISAMTDILSNKISGQALRSDEEKRECIGILRDEIFISFMNTVNPKEIFLNPVDRTQYPIDVLNNNSYNFVIDTGKMIISDRQGKNESQIPPIEMSSIQTQPIQTEPTQPPPIPSTSPYLNQEDIIRMKEKAEKATQLYIQPPQTTKPRAMTLSDLPPPTPEELKKYQEQTNMEVLSNKRRKPSSAPWGGKITRRYKKISNKQNKRSNRKKSANRKKNNSKTKTRRIHKKSKHIKKNTRRNRK